MYFCVRDVIRIHDINKEYELGEFLSTTDALDTDNEETNLSFLRWRAVWCLMQTIWDALWIKAVWASHLSRDDCVSISLFLCFQLTRHLGLAETKAAEVAEMMVGKCDKTTSMKMEERVAWKWWRDPGSEQSWHQCSGIVRSNEELKKKAAVYIGENAIVKGQLNLTTEKVLPKGEWWFTNENYTELAWISKEDRSWDSQKMDAWVRFFHCAKKKGTFADGHEWDNVLRYCTKFLRWMMSLGFLNASNVPRKVARTQCLLIWKLLMRVLWRK